MAGSQPWGEAPTEGRHQQVRLEQREVVADADPLAGGERMVGLRMARRLGLAGEAVGVEALGIVPEIGVTVRPVRASITGVPGSRWVPSRSTGSTASRT